MWCLLKINHFINIFIITILISDSILMVTSTVSSINVKDDSQNYKQFIEKDLAVVSKLAKCCPINSGLLQTEEEGKLNCSSSEIQLTHFELFSRKTLTNNTDWDSDFHENYCNHTECVDFLKINENWKLVHLKNCEIIKEYKQYSYFPKCCPYKYFYDPINHTCVLQDENKTDYFFKKSSLQAINVSLVKCPVGTSAITDFPNNFTLETNKQLKIQIENTFLTVDYGNYCIDKNANSGENIVRACVPYEEACVKLKRRCLKKCCPIGEIYIIRNRKSSCEPHYTIPFNVSNIIGFNKSDTEYAIITAEKGEKSIMGAKTRFSVDEMGNFYLENNGNEMYYEAREAPYCIEHWKPLNGKITQSTFLFMKVDGNAQFRRIKFYVHGVILGISCVFLLLTILCYIFLPEMQNVHGKSVLMFCVFMFFGSLVLCFNQIHGPQILRWLCKSFGYLIVFSFLGAFASLNVICFDMWMAFGTMRVLDIRNKQKEFKKLLYYSLYAWGVPITICGFALLTNYTECCLPKDFIPQIGITKCFFEKVRHSYDYLTFFIIPAATMILINLIFFIKTSVYCYKVKNEIQRMRTIDGDNKESKRRRFQVDKEKLIMLLKLFLVMGISWIFEIISSVVSFRETMTLQVIETICDCINAGEGIIIFCIFILKKRVLQSIKTRLGMLPTPQMSEFSSGFTNVSGTNYTPQIELNKKN